MIFYGIILTSLTFDIILELASKTYRRVLLLHPVHVRGTEDQSQGTQTDSET